MSASYVSCMMCFQFDGFVCDKTHKIFGRSTLEREPHDNNLSVRIKWECILILKTSRILSYLGLKPSFLNLKIGRAHV